MIVFHSMYVLAPPKSGVRVFLFMFVKHSNVANVLSDVRVAGR